MELPSRRAIWSCFCTFAVSCLTSGAWTRVSFAQTQPAGSPAPITIVRKPGHADGEAQYLEKGKVKKVAGHAVAAWRVRGGEGALVIVPGHKNRSGADQYLLRYY